MRGGLAGARAEARDRHRRLLAVALLAVAGVASIHAAPLIAYPAARGAARCLRALATGELETALAAFPDLLRFGGGVLLPGLIVLAIACGAERLCAAALPRAADGRRLWLVQLMFLAPLVVVLVSWARFAPRGAPLIAIDALPAIPRIMAGTALYLVLLAVQDLLLYALHRAMHRVPLLWRFHRIHHAEPLDALGNVIHPAEQLLNLLLAAVPVSLIARIGPAQALVPAALVAIHGPLVHSRLPLHFGRFHILLSDNRWHHRHHAIDEPPCNFAAYFPWIDRLFGTYQAPLPGPLPTTGISGQAPPQRLRDYLLGRLPASSTSDPAR